MRTIEQLNTLLEELEKRIRNISTAQSTFAQINNICTYIANVQDYLKELNIAFDDHVQNCQDYTDDISSLQNQINEISASLEELISNDETFNALKTSFDDLKSQFETFIGSSSTTAENLENDISLLQTTLASTEEDLQSLQSDLSDTNKTIGEHTTTITNLQTTQTNLQTTQSSQASTINSLNTRLANCENNVNSLSGGVDISDYEARLTALENSLSATYYQSIVLIRRYDSSENINGEVYFKLITKQKLLTLGDVMNQLQVNISMPATGYLGNKIVAGVKKAPTDTEFYFTNNAIEIVDSKLSRFYPVANGVIKIDAENIKYFIYNYEIF